MQTIYVQRNNIIVEKDMVRKNKRFFCFVILLICLFSPPVFLVVFASTPQWYPLSQIQPTVYDQGQSNWCGPGAAQSVIQWSSQYNDGTPTPAPTMIPKSELWQFMRDNTCQDIGYGRDVALEGSVGDGENDVRRLNIAYDFGVDPHALAWTMWRKTGPNHFYHYWVYYNSVDEATRSLLFTLEKYHEPVCCSQSWSALGSNYKISSRWSSNRKFRGCISDWRLGPFRAGRI
jgi:hypothetical protein